MISLKKVDTKNLWKIAGLKVREDQQDFVATNAESIMEAYVYTQAGAVALPFGIYAGDTPVGFVMFGYGELPEEENPAVAAGNYSIWRFMIDEKQQGKGYAKAAMQAALDYVRSFPCGPADCCWLSYEPENTAAKSLYHRFGFRENGQMDGDEIVAVLPLSEEPPNS